MAWTSPADAGSLDVSNGGLVTKVIWDYIRNNLGWLADALGIRIVRTTVTATTPYTMTTAEEAVVSTGATPTVKLPTTPTLGRPATIAHMGTGTMTISVDGGGTTIWDQSAVASITLAVGESQDFLGTGSYWKMV